MKYMTIKPFEEKYRDDVNMVCLNTGPGSVFTDENDRRYILSMYNNYYLDCEPENCFVLVDDNDTAQGYIICSSSPEKYSKGMKPYLELIKGTGLSNCFGGFGEYAVNCALSKMFPAHMHIDINDGFRRNGNGSALMNMLLDHLRESGVGSIQLIVGSGNKPAVSFYKKNGFKVYINLGEALLMGRKI